MFNNDREDDRHKAAELGISFDSRGNHYREYLDERHDQTRGSRQTASDVEPEWLSANEPSEAEQAQMAELGISFDGRHYHYGDYHYECFADARDYAILSNPQLKRTESG